jgi:hypothetical protein
MSFRLHTGAEAALEAVREALTMETPGTALYEKIDRARHELERALHEHERYEVGDDNSHG